MIILTKVVLVMMISLILSIITGAFLIPLLKRLKVGQRLSEYLEEKHKSKQGTPTMGGLIFIIPTVIVMIFMFLFDKIKGRNQMATVLVDAKYFGDYLRMVRNSMNITRFECAKLLGVSHSELIKIENGRVLMPDKIIQKVMTNGMAMILCKRRK